MGGMMVQRVSGRAPQGMMIQGGGVQNFGGTQVNDYQINPMVTERHIVTQQKKIIRKTMKPVRKQIGTEQVPYVETVEVKNPSTMKMDTEYAEPYIKRDGYSTDVMGQGVQTTTVRRTTNTMGRGAVKT